MNIIITVLVLLLSLSLNAQDWASVVSNTNETLNKIHFIDDNTGFIIGNNGTLLKTTNGGMSWSSINTGLTDHLTTISFANDSIGFINGLQTIDGGTTWVQQTSTSPYGLIKALDANTLLGGSGIFFDGQIWKSTDGGATWSSIASPIPTGFYTDAVFTNPTTGFMTSWYSGNVIKTTDGGASWTTLLPGGSFPLILGVYGIEFPSSDTGIVSYTGNILKTTNGGTTWTSVFPSNGNARFEPRGSFAISSDHYIVVGRDNGTQPTIERIYVTTDGGASWALFNRNAPMLYDVACTSSNCFAVGANGIILTQSNALHIDDLEVRNERVKIYPNPSTRHLNIDALWDIEDLTVCDLTGKHITDIKLEQNKLNIEKLNSGIYFMSIKAKNNEIQTIKFIKE